MSEKKGRGCQHVVLEAAEPVTHVIISDYVVAVCVDCCHHFESVAAELDRAVVVEPEKKRRVAAG